MTARLATLTIGQAPRLDMVVPIEKVLPVGVSCVHAGVLDGMTKDDVLRKFGAKPNSERLITRLRSGETVVLDHDAMAKGIQSKIDELRSKGSEVILLLCTGKFEGLTAPGVVLLEPDHVLPPLVNAVFGRQQVGLIVPLESQVDACAAKWRDLETTIIGTASPYDDDPDAEALVRTAIELKQEGAKVIVLDCMAFSHFHQYKVARFASLPVLLPSSMMTVIASELLSSRANH